MEKMNVNPEIKKQIFIMYKNVKFLREKNELTIKQLAEIIGISEKKLIQAESCTDAGYFYDKHIRNICLYFKVNADILFRRKIILKKAIISKANNKSEPFTNR